MTVINPTIGDVIQVFHTRHSGGAGRAAIVTGVRQSGAATVVYATAFSPDGSSSAIELPLHRNDWQAAGGNPDALYWAWPPTRRI